MNKHSPLLIPSNLVKLSRMVSKVLGEELTEDENRMLLNMVKKIDHNTVKHYSNDELIAKLSVIIAKQIRKNNDKDTNMKNKETKEALIPYAQEYEYDLTKLFGISDKYALLRTCNPQSMYQYNFIILSTANSTISDNNPYSFSWQVTENNTLSTGMVNIKPVKNLIGIRLFPLKFIYAWPSTIHPYQTTDTSIQFVHYTLLIQELINQSILGYNNTRFHFTVTSTKTTYNTNYLELAAKKDNNYYWFNPPIVSLPSITLRINNYLGQTGFPLSYVSVIIRLVNPVEVWVPNATLSLVNGMICRFYDPVIYFPTLPVNHAFITALTDSTGYAITLMADTFN